MKKFSLLLAVLAITTTTCLHSRTEPENIGNNSPILPQADEALSISGVSKPASICVNKKAGKIFYTIQGGKAAFTVRLFKGDGTFLTSQSNVQISTGSFSNLENGTYKLQVIDSSSPINTASSTLIVVNNSCKPRILLCCCR